MKAKVIEVIFRKDSEAFPQWMKYEVTLLWEDGRTELIPAYGRDLQDALSRVKHDFLIETLGEKTKKIPATAYVVLWFAYLAGWTQLTYIISKSGENSTSFNGLFFISGLILFTAVAVIGTSWFMPRNKDRRGK